MSIAFEDVCQVWSWYVKLVLLLQSSGAEEGWLFLYVDEDARAD
jgi:hypothetical protein